MTDATQGIVSEARNNRFSTLQPTMSDDDVVSVWENVSNFIEKQMSNQKGVNIPGLGTFTFSQKKLDVGNNKYILIQRPIFLLSEKFAQTHQVHCTKYHVSGQIPTVQLNFSALSFESPFDRDTVEACVKEVLQALARSVGARRNVEFQFPGIGRLHIRNSKVKMKFFKEFINSMDGSGQLVNALKDRPNTVDSVISEGHMTRCGSSNTLILPSSDRASKDRIITRDQMNKGGDDAVARKASMPTINESDEAATAAAAAAAEGDGLMQADDVITSRDIQCQDLSGDQAGAAAAADDKATGQDKKATSRAPSRATVPLAQATGFSFGDEYPAADAGSGDGAGDEDMVSPVPKGHREPSVMSQRSGPTPMMLKRALSPINSPRSPLDSARPVGVDAGSGAQTQRALGSSSGLKKPEPLYKLPSPPPLRQTQSACGHQNAGQELCYLCHQRDSRNIPVNFSEERKMREKEEERLLRQYQQMKDTESILKTQENLLAKRHESQKMAAFNLGVADAISTKRRSRDTNFQPSFIFQKRPLTPPRFFKQQKYFGDLHEQVTSKADEAKKRRSDEEFLERLEQVQLAEDLAMQRDSYLKEKHEQTDMYKRALSAQLRFKPLPLPARVPDSDEPVFGKHDMNASKMAERRRIAHELFREQVATVEQRKRDSILKQLSDQKEAEQMLERTRQDLREDRADRFERMFKHRKRLEQDWASATLYKKEKEEEERQRLVTPGGLMHEQCDKYRRCAQCKRHLQNCGESNIWRETRYIPGTRIMV